MPATPEDLAAADRWLLVDRSRVTLDGAECDKVSACCRRRRPPGLLAARRGRREAPGRPAGPSPLSEHTYQHTHTYTHATNKILSLTHAQTHDGNNNTTKNRSAPASPPSATSRARAAARPAAACAGSWGTSLTRTRRAPPRGWRRSTRCGSSRTARRAACTGARLFGRPRSLGRLCVVAAAAPYALAHALRAPFQPSMILTWRLLPLPAQKN